VTAVDELVDSLLYEGYALYPYTPGATKNATPTPFGIVYPPAYAERNASTWDKARIACLHKGDGELSAEVRFLQASGQRHEGVERRVELSAPGKQEFSFGALTGRVALRVEDATDGRRMVRCCVHNTTPLEEGNIGRSEALLSSLLSTHLLVRATGGRFLSPLEHNADSLNSYPVLASDDDRAVLGAAIVLPEHPQLAPESHGGLFDNTEIEEALLLHVRALSDAERDEIAQQDPAVREMIERAAAATPEDLKRLHGRLTLHDPRAGEEEASAGGVTFRRGAKVVLRPDPERDPYDRMLHGMSATIERIFLDYDDDTRVNLAVVIDDDPARDLMRETGRYHFFKPREVELLDA
jgi:hypothetical protein